MSFQDFRRPRDPYRAAGGGTMAAIGSEQVVLTTMKRARWAEGWVVRLREIAGRPQVGPIAMAGKRIARAWLTDLLEDEIRELPVEADGTVRVSVSAWGLATVRLVLEEGTSG